MTGVEFTVYGLAQPAGSKRGFHRGGRVIIVDAAAKSRPWKAQVSDAAALAMADAGISLIRDPLEAHFTFYVPRPKGHYGSGRNATVLKPSAPVYPTSRPDLLKLARAVEDSCTGIVYSDDSLIVREALEKIYGEPARVEVSLYTLSPHGDT